MLAINEVDPVPDAEGEATDSMTFASEADVADAPLGSPPAILVVDDEPGIRKLARMTLQGIGIPILEAPNGAEALEILRREGRRIRVMVLDLAMPVMNGEELLRKLQEEPYVPRVVLASGYLKDDTTARLLKLGVECVLKKPYALPDLIQSVRSALDRPA